jgi:hypothetical protein
MLLLLLLLLQVDSQVSLLDIPFGNSFSVHVRFLLVASHTSPRRTALTILVGVNFTKSTMFESKIRADSLQELRVTYLEWAAQAADTMRAAPAHSDKTVQPPAPAAS